MNVRWIRLLKKERCERRCVRAYALLYKGLIKGKKGRLYSRRRVNDNNRDKTRSRYEGNGALCARYTRSNGSFSISPVHICTHKYIYIYTCLFRWPNRNNLTRGCWVSRSEEDVSRSRYAQQARWNLKSTISSARMIT